MKFTYTAYDRAGKVVSAAIDASSAAEAGDLLRKQGLFTTTSSSSGDAAAHPAPGSRKAARGAGGRTKRLRAMATFVRQLSILVSTGTPIIDAITSLEKQIPAGHWRGALGDIRARIEQ